MTYSLWHKRAAQSMKSRRHLFEQGCRCLLQNYFARSNTGDIGLISYGCSYHELMALLLEKVFFFLSITAGSNSKEMSS